MKAELADHTLDSPGADGLAGLAQFLGNHGRRGIRIQEAVTDHLLDDLIGAAVVGFRAAFLVLQGRGAASFELVAQLEVALFGKAEFGGSGQGTHAFALTFKEHGQFGENGIVRRCDQFAGRAAENQGIFGDFEHGLSIARKARMSNKIWRIPAELLEY